MKFYLYDKNDNAKELSMEEVRKHLSELQIKEAIEAKIEDPDEEVCYMTVGGIIGVEF
jgi:tRNA threonylcarbamoyladenosine modification (KEOPS) complex Cgi121 subunit